MTRLLGLLLEICLLRRGPQDLPYSIALTRGLVLSVIGANLLYVRLVDLGDNALAQAALSVTLLLLLPWILLQSRGLQARYAQTLAAFAGTGALFALVSLPVARLAVSLSPVDSTRPPTREEVTVGLLTLLLIGWKLAIDGHIWKHALDWPRVAGVLLATGLFVLEVGLVRALFATAT